MRTVIVCLMSVVSVSGCATMGQRSTDTLGIVEHEVEANAHERSAAAHRRNAGDYTPAACSASLTGCPPGTINVRAAAEFEQAERDERVANYHRARIEELRDAELRAPRGSLSKSIGE